MKNISSSLKKAFWSSSSRNTQGRISRLSLVTGHLYITITFCSGEHGAKKIPY